MRLVSTVYPGDEQKLTALQMDAVIHGRPNPVKKIRDSAFRDGLFIGGVVTIAMLFLFLMLWQIGMGL